MVDFLLDRKHRTRYAGQQSVDASINASVVQGSGFGPSAYVVVASDLHPVHDHNVIVKFADDTYLIVPGSKRDTINKELEGIQHWASLNNLKLNPNKSKKMLFRRRTRTVILPQPLPGIERVDSMIVLGVNISYDFRASAHVDRLLGRCTIAPCMPYVFCVLMACHRMPYTMWPKPLYCPDCSMPLHPGGV